MREPVTSQRITSFMRELAVISRGTGRVYLTGGATAVLFGWRESTLDIDIKVIPEDDRVLRAIPELKERLHLNVELASPADFIPLLPGWEERSRFIAKEGTLFFHHYDFYAQCLAKIERGHRKDLADVHMMLEQGLVARVKLMELFRAIQPELYRYPAIDPASFGDAVYALAGARVIPSDA